MLKKDPHPDYPTEEGCYLRGNDYSPVVVAVILTYDSDKVPKDIEDLVRTGVESGAALSGSIQTENIGIEKMICNIIGNPNIRYIVLTGPESPGHSTGQTIKALHANGIDGRKKIIGSEAPTPYLYNIPAEYVERFRKQIVSIIDLINHGTPDIVRKAVWSCFQEEATDFEGLSVHDVGAYPEDPICGRITWRVTNPANEPRSEEEKRHKDLLIQKMEEIKRIVEDGKKRKQSN
jgi:tetrahydromethanopterin S-methyltransferase subunit A